MKFKVGDRVVATNDFQFASCKGISGTIVEIIDGDVPYGVRFDKNVNGHSMETSGFPCTYGFGFYMPEDLLKPANGKSTEGKMKKFNWKKFKGNGRMCVHCKTEDEAKRFCKMMDEHKMAWNTGASFLSHNNFDVYHDCTCYYGDGSYGSENCVVKRETKMLEFSDYFGKESHYPTITITTDGKHTTAKMCKGDKVLKKAAVSLYYKDKFSLVTGAQEAVKKLFGKQSKVKEVRRHARTGEYIKIVNASPYHTGYNNGDIVKVSYAANASGIVDIDVPVAVYVNDSEYVVLENYKPQEDK